MFSKDKIVFVGAGPMAEAIIAGLVNNRLVSSEQIWVTNYSDNQRLAKLEEKYLIQTTRDYHVLFEGSTIIILAMKPKDVADSLLSIGSYVNESHLLLSVLAGVSLDYFEKTLNKPIPVIRAMPNTSATVSQSATAITVGKYSNEKHVQRAQTLFTSIGMVEIVAEEELHAVTGISGSGPAYLYYVAEALEEAANKQGLSEEVARKLVIQTFIGVANMLHQTTEPPSLLRKNIMSPGGTTEAGINALDNHQFKQAIHDCVEAAVKKSQELEAKYK